MKKIFVYGLMLCTMAFGFTACNDDEDQHTDTRVTNYIVLNVNGDEVVYVDVNSNYVDAGCSAELAGEDVSDKVLVNNPVDTSVMGPYVITYRAVNEDGFGAEAYRYVYVGSPLTGSVSEGSYRQTAAGAIVNWSGYDLFMLTDGNGKYWTEDLLGGYYALRAGYGFNYAMEGFMQVNEDNTVDFVGGGYVPGWGDELDDFKNGVYDPETNTISYDCVYAGMDFNVVLTLN